MAKAKYGIAVDEEIVEEVDKLVAECDDLGASRSEFVKAILTAFSPTQITLNRYEKSVFGDEKGL